MCKLPWLSNLKTRSEIELVTEFAGTLLGFDDYVSMYCSPDEMLTKTIDCKVDMVLEDVTELFV